MHCFFFQPWIFVISATIIIGIVSSLPVVVPPDDDNPSGFHGSIGSSWLPQLRKRGERISDEQQLVSSSSRPVSLPSSPNAKNIKGLDHLTLDQWEEYLSTRDWTEVERDKITECIFKAVSSVILLYIHNITYTHNTPVLLYSIDITSLLGFFLSLLVVHSIINSSSSFLPYIPFTYSDWALCLGDREPCREDWKGL